MVSGGAGVAERGTESWDKVTGENPSLETHRQRQESEGRGQESGVTVKDYRSGGPKLHWEKKEQHRQKD